MKNLVKLLGLGLIVLAAAYLGYADGRGQRPTRAGTAPANDNHSFAADSHSFVTAPTSPDSPLPYHGVAIQVSWTADGIDRYIRMIDQIAELGADTIKISTAGYQEHAGSATINLELRKCPTGEDFRKLIGYAHSRGLRVILMPVVLLSNPRGSEWRGVIQPDDWDTWFAEYLKFIRHFAKIAAKNNVEVLVVGSELISTETFTDRWEKIIAEVRNIYRGKLAYSGNWDHYKVVKFWDKLDLIGMTTYYQLADEENPPLKTLMDSWAKIKSEILEWQRDIGKPILFTEVGWCSQPGASIEAWNYYRHSSPSPEGLEEQRKCYQAFMQTWSQEPAVGGIIWWEWTDDPGGPEDYGYTPKGKPAEDLLRAWFATQGNHRLANVNSVHSSPAGISFPP